MLSNIFNFEGIEPGKFAIYLGIVLIVYGSILLWVFPAINNQSGLEPQDNISVGHSDHFQSVITKLNFIMDSDSQKISIYYNILPTDKNGFLAIVLPYKGNLEINNKKWYSEQLPSGSTVLFTNVTCSSNCVTDEDEFVFQITGKLDSITYPNHIVQLPFSNGISSEVVDEFHKIANGTSYRIGWDMTSTSIQMTLNKRFDERTTEPVARLSLIPNKDKGGNNYVLNWDLEKGNTVFAVKYSDNDSRELSEFRQTWTGIGIGSGITMIAAGAALVRNEEGIRELRRFVKIQRYMQDANTAFTVKNYETAKQHYDLASKIDPKDTDPILLAGNSFYEMKRYDEAIPYYKKILKTNPKHIGSLNNIGACLAGLKQHDKAFEYYEKVLKIEPNHLDSLLNAGAAILDLGFPEYSIPYFDEVLRIDKKDVMALSNKGKAISFKNRDEAMELFNIALSINPKKVEPLIYKAETLFALDRYEESLSCYNLILKIDPFNRDALQNKGGVLIGLNRHKEALECFIECIVTAPNEPIIVYNLGMCYAGLDDKDNAIMNFNRALKLDVKEIEIIRNIGGYFVLHNLPDRAIKECFHKILKKDENNADAMYGMSLAFDKLGNHVEGQAWYQKFLDTKKSESN